MVAYAYAAAHPSSTRRLVLLEAPQVDEMAYQLPAWTQTGPGLWNFGFFTLDNGLQEKIVAGREDIWVEGFVGWMERVKGGVDDQAIAEYAQALRRPGYLHVRIRKSCERASQEPAWPVRVADAVVVAGAGG
jgi:pimeloyl-ACP methyl ester carboxylesterase